MEQSPDNSQRQSAAASDDRSRRATATHGNDYSLSVEDASVLYEQAGHPRTPRSIQRYCAKNHLVYRRAETPFGDKLLITRASVIKHIAYINDVRPVAAGRDTPRHSGNGVAGESKAIDLPVALSTGIEQPQRPARDDRYVAALERENEFLRDQVKVKDTQISGLQERAHETNALINGLQRLLAPLLSAPGRDILSSDGARSEERI